MIRVANEPFIFSMVYALVSPFLKAKLRQRLKTVSNRYEEIYKILDGNNGNDENWKSLLPKNIGGKKSWSGMTAATTQKVLDHYKQYSSIWKI